MGDQEDFLSFLRRSGLTLTCPKCGGHNWGVVRNDLAIRNPEGNLKPVFFIRCDTCGHERFFSPTDPGGEPGD